MSQELLRKTLPIMEIAAGLTEEPKMKCTFPLELDSGDRRRLDELHLLTREPRAEIIRKLIRREHRDVSLVWQVPPPESDRNNE